MMNNRNIAIQYIVIYQIRPNSIEIDQMNQIDSIDRIEQIDQIDQIHQIHQIHQVIEIHSIDLIVQFGQSRSRSMKSIETNIDSNWQF